MGLGGSRSFFYFASGTERSDYFREQRCGVGGGLPGDLWTPGRDPRKTLAAPLSGSPDTACGTK